VLTIAIVTYVAVYLSRSGISPRGDRGGELIAPARRPLARFLLLAMVFTAAYFALAPWLYDSRALYVVAAWAAGAAAIILSALGASVAVSGNILQTTHGAFVVTQECVATPLIPAYAAAVLSAPWSPARRALAFLLGAPLFFVLATVRLLVLAVPQPLMPSPAIAIHGFSQVLLALGLVAAVALWWRSGESSWERGSGGAWIAIGIGTLAGLVAGTLWGRLIAFLVPVGQALMGHAGHSYPDPQGALLILPAFQVGLLVALWTAIGRLSTWRRLAVGVCLLGLSQAVLVWALGELSHYIGFAPHVSLIRAWAIAAPVVVASLIERPFRRPPAGTTLATEAHRQAPAYPG
jgi:hypothetical protein